MAAEFLATRDCYLSFVEIVYYVDISLFCPFRHIALFNHQVVLRWQVFDGDFFEKTYRIKYKNDNLLPYLLLPRLI